MSHRIVPGTVSHSDRYEGRLIGLSGRWHSDGANGRYEIITSHSCWNYSEWEHSRNTMVCPNSLTSSLGKIQYSRYSLLPSCWQDCRPHCIKSFPPDERCRFPGVFWPGSIRHPLLSPNIRKPMQAGSGSACPMAAISLLSFPAWGFSVRVPACSNRFGSKRPRNLLASGRVTCVLFSMLLRMPA